jgi:SOS-response transcriptional repressor LexA
MSFALTHEQGRTLAFIRTYLADHHKAPSMEEIAAHLGLKSKSGAYRLVKGLEERGHIRRLPKRARAMALTEHKSMLPKPRIVEVPFVRITVDAMNRVRRIERSGDVKVFTVKERNVLAEGA